MDAHLCDGCRTVINDKKVMHCQGCNQKYDLQCANLSPKRYKAMNDEGKRKWRCVECNNKLPKMDNTNTPVRSLNSAKSAPSKPEVQVENLSHTSNVTLRRVPSPSNNYITEDNLKKLLKANKQDLMDVIESCNSGLSDQLKAINVQCTGYQESLSFMSIQYDELRKEISALTKLLGNTSSELKSVKDENKILKDSLKAQSARIKILEDENLKQQQWSRMQNVEVTGIPENKEEDTTDVVMKVIQHIGVPIQPTDIEFAHRVQPRHAASAAQARARSIIVRLKQRATKDRVVAAARKHRNLSANDLKMGDETTRIFINEHLTKENKMLLNSSKLRAKEVRFKFVWTKNCRVYVRRNETSPPILISSPVDLAKIV